MRTTHRPKSTVNIAARQLRTPCFRPLTVKSRKAYTRKLKHGRDA